MWSKFKSLFIFTTIGGVGKRVFTLPSSRFNENLPSVRNSTPIIAWICLRLDIASPQQLDPSLFAFILCFFTEKRFYAAVFAFNVATHRAHATPTARTALRQVTYWIVNNRRQWEPWLSGNALDYYLGQWFDSDRSDLSSNLMQVAIFF